MIKSFQQNKYPFNLDQQELEEFNNFLVKYIIHQDYFKDNVPRFYSLDEILGAKKPNTTKF